MLEFYPTPNQPGTALVGNYLALNNNITNKDQFTSRIDPVKAPSQTGSAVLAGTTNTFSTPRFI
jgi:hypothetical protein